MNIDFVISAFQRFSISAFQRKLWLLPLAWLWLVLINDLRVEWTVNPQYSYGWAVPFLCVFLLWQRFQMADDGRQNVGVRSHDGEVSAFRHFSFQLLFSSAFLYAPTRLVEEANPAGGW